ncbi:FeoB-associated Cys-rich membrane protein [Haloimpatiens lingqiaonensis]|uniref:FeoB-associated Cys-rich membrane protein n=1 Tax=Haloimpatiens lingqiaonensis TaxID=1380675 RepID=UPI0010FD2A9C|nr:FeoB-associated Cys-rich membrane protein [Haloimpatiens lingqiaonensis]
MEILITLALISIAFYFLYKSIRNKAKGKCDCSSCSSHCPYYDNKLKEEQKKNHKE